MLLDEIRKEKRITISFIPMFSQGCIERRRIINFLNYFLWKKNICLNEFN
jgi:hypothetical protein